MSFGQTWNLYCSKCRHAWVSKIYGPEITCPSCGNTFQVAYRDFTAPVKAFHEEHQARMKARGKDVAQKHVEAKGSTT